MSRAVIGAEVSYTTWGTPITHWEIFSRENFEKNLFLGKKSLFSVFFQHKIVHAASKILKKSWKCVVIVKFYIPLPQTASLLGYF